MATACTQANHFGQAGGGDGSGAALFQAYVDGHGLGTSDLYQLFGRAGVQAVGVQNAHAAGLGAGGFTGQRCQQLGAIFAHKAVAFAVL